MDENSEYAMQCEGMTVQQINGIVRQLKDIMEDKGISQTHLVNVLDGKVARSTVLRVFKDSDCTLGTLLMILDACGIELRLDTERSKEAIMAGDIAEYRKENEEMRGKLAEAEENRKFFKERYEELIEKNTTLTKTNADQQKNIDKMQTQIEKYMERMERAENALYASNDDVRRKDAKIVELLNEREILKDVISRK